ncbi:hypothetical protein BH09PLA1_BH09PLA1_19580 [soil metagenome]
MNNRQRLVIAIGIALLALNSFFPPREQGNGSAIDRAFLLSPMVARHYVDQDAFVVARVDLRALMVSSIIIGGVTVLATAISRRIGKRRAA